MEVCAHQLHCTKELEREAEQDGEGAWPHAQAALEGCSLRQREVLGLRKVEMAHVAGVVHCPDVYTCVYAPRCFCIYLAFLSEEIV